MSGRGEPTLAKNLGEAIKEIKKIRHEPIAVLTNSSLIMSPDVRRELALADMACCKIDAFTNSVFHVMNKPAALVYFNGIIKGIKLFKSKFKGKLALQFMFTNENIKEAGKLADLARQISPDEIHIGTPLRPSPVKALNKAQIRRIKGLFKGFRVLSPYDKAPTKVNSLSPKETLRRRGKP